MAYRKLQLNNEDWEYIIGDKGVKMRSPKGKCTWAPHHEILGMTKEQYRDKIWTMSLDEYGDHSGNTTIAIGPGDVKRYIRGHNE